MTKDRLEVVTTRELDAKTRCRGWKTQLSGEPSVEKRFWILYTEGSHANCENISGCY